jgi:hypothetical protein
LYFAINNQVSTPKKMNYTIITHDGVKAPNNSCDPKFSHILNVSSMREIEENITLFGGPTC